MITRCAEAIHDPGDRILSNISLCGEIARTVLTEATRPDPETVERVARAIWEARRKKTAKDYPELAPLEEWDDGRIPTLNGVIEEAKAAIAALVSP